MLDASCQDRTETYHYHARCLHGVAPVGRYHRNNVLWLLHSVYWYKAEAMFTECCHVFNTAVREAQELGTLYHGRISSYAHNMLTCS